MPSISKCFPLILLINLLSILKVLVLPSRYHPWPHEFGFPPGEVVIDRSWPLVVLPDSTLPNLVAVSESSSASMPSSNDDATLINLEQVLNFRNKELKKKVMVL